MRGLGRWDGDTVAAAYSSDTSFAGSSGAESGGQVVGQASTTTTVASSGNPSAIGQSVTFTATVAPGSGTFDNGGTVQSQKSTAPTSARR